MNTQTSESYLRLQARLLVYTILFWLSVNIIYRQRYQLTRVKTLGFDIIQVVITRTGLIRSVRYAKEQLKLELLRFSFITNAQQFLRGFNYTLFKISEFFSLKNVPNASLATLIFVKIGEFIQLVKNVNRSLSSIASTFSINVKQILKWPRLIRNALSACSQQIRQFWQQIEQIIQIVKLPLEILSLIFGFIKGVGTFMRRIEAPRISRFR